MGKIYQWFTEAEGQDRVTAKAKCKMRLWWSRRFEYVGREKRTVWITERIRTMEGEIKRPTPRCLFLGFPCSCPAPVYLTITIFTHHLPGGNLLVFATKQGSLPEWSRIRSPIDWKRPSRRPCLPSQFCRWESLGCRGERTCPRSAGLLSLIQVPYRLQTMCFLDFLHLSLGFLPCR